MGTGESWIFRRLGSTFYAFDLVLDVIGLSQQIDARMWPSLSYNVQPQYTIIRAVLIKRVSNHNLIVLRLSSSMYVCTRSIPLQ
jgi:hypothetical protein